MHIVTFIFRFLSIFFNGRCASWILHLLGGSLCKLYKENQFEQVMHGCLNLIKIVFRVIAHDSQILSVFKMARQFQSIEPHISNDTCPIIWRFSYDRACTQQNSVMCQKRGRGPLLVRALFLPCRQLPFLPCFHVDFPQCMCMEGER